MHLAGDRCSVRRSPPDARSRLSAQPWSSELGDPRSPLACHFAGAPNIRRYSRLTVLKAAPEGVDWFHLVPAGEFGRRNPGSRTGQYRVSSTSQVTDDEVRPLLGVEDYAVAFGDEVETPRTHRGRPAIGY